MSLEAATWVTAAATVIFAVFAVVTARTPAAHTSPSQPSSTTSARNCNRQPRDANATRPSGTGPRLSRCTCGASTSARCTTSTPPQIAARVHNTSQQPVYDLRFGHLVGKPCFIYDGRIMSLTPYVMPGAEERGIVDVPADKRPGKSGVSASFRDRAGTWGRTWPDGLLKEISEPADVTGTPPAATPAMETAADVRPPE